MQELPTILGSLFVAVSLVLIAVSIPLFRGRIARNRSYGFGFAPAHESEEAWLAINRYGGKRLITWSMPLLAFGLAMVLAPRDWTIPQIVVAAHAPVIVVVPVVETYRFAKRYPAES